MEAGTSSLDVFMKEKLQEEGGTIIAG